jgi:putative redox protein
MAKVIVQSLPDYTHAQMVTMAGRALIADEPGDEGGDDLGPTPYELLTAALGACTAMTIQIYARRKGIPLVEVAVEVEHARTHAEDCEDCIEQREGMVQVFRRKIVLRGDLSEAQRLDLLAVARRCPVHRTLAANPEVIDTAEVVA